LLIERNSVSGEANHQMQRLLLAGVLFFTISPGVPAAVHPIAPDWSLITPDQQVVKLSDVAQEQTTVLLF